MRVYAKEIQAQCFGGLGISFLDLGMAQGPQELHPKSRNPKHKRVGSCSVESLHASVIPPALPQVRERLEVLGFKDLGSTQTLGRIWKVEPPKWYPILLLGAV